MKIIFYNILYEMDAPVVVEPSKAIGKVAEAYTLTLQTLRDIFGMDARSTMRNAEANAKAALIESMSKMKVQQAEMLHGFLLKDVGDYLYHQKNMDAVLQIAAPMFNAETKPENLSESFKHRFADAAQDADEQEMRELWARVLAQEAKQPNTVSRRTIEVMKSLSKDDALLIIKLAPYLLDLGKNVAAMDITNLKIDGAPKYDLTLEDVLKLEALGFVHYTSTLSITFKAKSNIFIKYGEVHILGNAGENSPSFPAFPITNIAKEIFRVVEGQKNYKYLQEVIDHLESSGVFLKEMGSSGLVQLKKKQEENATTSD